MDVSFIDASIISVYCVVLILVALWCSRKIKNQKQYYVGDQSIKPYHIGFSVAATDVGGGFSIGLGALGFTMGISGSWLLFSGLLGAFLSAVFFIPRLKLLEKKHSLMSFPQLFESRYGKTAAALAALISIVGYVGFTSSQLIAGSKLSTVIAPEFTSTQILCFLALLVTFYTAMGGFAAVVYTDSIQWFVLLFGLTFFALPMAFMRVGGLEGLQASLPEGFLNPFNISIKQFWNWMVAIVPIWFVAMTLYQRVFACKNVKDAQRAWYIAGFLEWPGMACVGALLGLISKAALEQGLFTSIAVGVEIDPELAIPLLLKNILPIGVLGLVFAAYLSAVLSTADSCLMAASGNLLSDVLEKVFKKSSWSQSQFLYISKLCTLALGLISLIIAVNFKSALSLMLYSYSFMISGLTVPAIAAVLKTRFSQKAAISAMLGGGVTTVVLSQAHFSPYLFGLDANTYGLIVSFMFFVVINRFSENSKRDMIF
ncbi:sodium:solute symporter family protein [bacterium]|nr:sodium:solute symporter family protein [bacterium]